LSSQLVFSHTITSFFKCDSNCVMFTGCCYHPVIASLIQLPPWLGSTADSYHSLVGLFFYLFVCLYVSGAFIIAL